MKKDNIKTVGADVCVRPSKKARLNKGITLIALVITIIVMLILVAVTITMAVNGGLFEYAGIAGVKTNEAIDAEQTLGSGKVNVDGKWYNNIDDYINNKPIIELPEGIKVGDYVNYTPGTGTYKVADGANGSGYTTEDGYQEFVTEEDNPETTNENEALEWRILSINEQTKEIELVSATAGQTLYLQGADGYNHGVDILHDLCEALYSKTVNGTKVAIGRSINEEDITEKLIDDYKTSIYTEEYGKVYALTEATYYPNIYSVELGSTEKGLNETKSMLKEWDRVEKGIVNVKGVTQYTKYTGSSTTNTLIATNMGHYAYRPENYLNTSLGVNTVTKGLFGIGNGYWLATRSVEVVDIKNSGIGCSYPGFGIGSVSFKGDVGNASMFSVGYNNDTGEYLPDEVALRDQVRPVVSITSYSSIKKDTTKSDDTVTYWNIEF